MGKIQQQNVQWDSELIKRHDKSGPDIRLIPLRFNLKTALTNMLVSQVTKAYNCYPCMCTFLFSTMFVITARAILSDDKDQGFSIEINPRKLQPGTLAHLKNIGFNRVSLRVQDFNENVQIAVNRMQSLTLTRDTLL
jgi:histone acetyltransferase (RNA polymerase elongator complex component)